MYVKIIRKHLLGTSTDRLYVMPHVCVTSLKETIYIKTGLQKQLLKKISSGVINMN